MPAGVGWSHPRPPSASACPGTTQAPPPPPSHCASGCRRRPRSRGGVRARPSPLSRTSKVATPSHLRRRGPWPAAPRRTLTTRRLALRESADSVQSHSRQTQSAFYALAGDRLFATFVGEWDHPIPFRLRRQRALCDVTPLRAPSSRSASGCQCRPTWFDDEPARIHASSAHQGLHQRTRAGGWDHPIPLLIRMPSSTRPLLAGPSTAHARPGRRRALACCGSRSSRPAITDRPRRHPPPDANTGVAPTCHRRGWDDPTPSASARCAGRAPRRATPLQLGCTSQATLWPACRSRTGGRNSGTVQTDAPSRGCRRCRPGPTVGVRALGKGTPGLVCAFASGRAPRGRNEIVKPSHSAH